MNERSTILQAQTATGRASAGSRHRGPSANDAALDRLLREAGAERVRLARLSLRITGVETVPKTPREPLLDQLDRLIGRGDRSLGRLGRVMLLFREEAERARNEDVVVIDFRTRERTVVRVSEDEIEHRVRERLEEEHRVNRRAQRRARQTPRGR